ncbi:MAG: flagellar M-ring protein [Candidatus Tectimicrobiota bacterium]|nr:MAG: flagellar M-ring protein [Candidatus Tectomicrobia bacterium]
MLARFRELARVLPARLRALPPARLFALLGLLGTALAVGVVSLLWLAGPPAYRVLYAQLTVEDAAAIAAKLRDLHVPYRLEGDGTTILVPAASVYDLRLQLAAEGLPQGGGAGFELFDQRSLGMTEFMQQLNYRRALQGELARTIAQLAAVQSARVHIVLPEKTLFLEQQERPTASVVLRLVPGRQLSPEQIRGIAHLVASSVEGLRPEDVTLLDSSGRLLNRQELPASALSLSQAQLAYKQTLERTLEARIQTMLEHVLGPGKALARVSADLDFQQIERTEERYDADNPAIRSEQRTQESGSGAGFWAIGVPGVPSNVPQNTPPPQPPTTSTSRQSETVNYELSKVVSKIVAPSGEIRQLSVAVLIDGTYQVQEGKRRYVPRSEEEMAKFRDIVKSAVGYNAARGDQVVVVNVPFTTPETDAAQALAAAQRQAFWLTVGRYGVYALLALLALLFVIRPLIAWVTRGGEPHTAELPLPQTVQELEGAMAAEGAALPQGPEGAAALPEEEPREKTRLQRLQERAVAFVRAEPERAAEMIRMWMRS